MMDRDAAEVLHRVQQFFARACCSSGPGLHIRGALDGARASHPGTGRSDQANATGIAVPVVVEVAVEVAVALEHGRSIEKARIGASWREAHGTVYDTPGDRAP